MTPDQTIELAKQVYGTDKWSDAQLERLQRFAELVRNAAIDECVAYVRNQGFGTIASNAMKERLKS